MHLMYIMLLRAKLLLYSKASGRLSFIHFNEDYVSLEDKPLLSGFVICDVYVSW